ncbi:MAG: Ig-like domain-containing protein [Thermoplasmata archaeon]|nr:Ig-like domain-containing protein [Thermoplasmata archaeon]
MRKLTFLLAAALGLAAIVASPTIIAYNNGVSVHDYEYDCGGSCHDTQSTCAITMAASNVTPAPSMSLTLWVNITGGEAHASPLGVMIVSATSTSNSLPSIDGWTIMADPSGSTAYNYYQITSYSDSASLMWQLTAPSTLGIHMLFAREMHGNGGIYATDYSAGLMFTVATPADGGDDGGDDGGTVTNLPTLVITSPSNAATIKGNMTINANVVSVDEIVSAALKIDGNLIGQKTAAPFTWVIDTRNMTDGGHVIVISVTDSTGDTVTKEVAVFVDNESDMMSMLEWLVTMGAGTVAIISVSGMLVVLALYIRKRVVSRRGK